MPTATIVPTDNLRGMFHLIKGDVGPGTKEILQLYDKTERDAAVARAKYDVIKNKKSITNAVHDNRLPSGEAPCTHQNISKYVNQFKALPEGFHFDDSTEEGRRNIAHEKILVKYWKAEEEGKVGRGKTLGIKQIRQEVEAQILLPGDKRLKDRTLRAHAKSGASWSGKLGRRVDTYGVTGPPPDREKIEKGKRVLIVPPHFRFVEGECHHDKVFPWVFGRVVDNTYAADGMRLYDVSYEHTTEYVDIDGGDLGLESHVPEYFVALPGIFGKSSTSFAIPDYKKFWIQAQARTQHYGHYRRHVIMTRQEEGAEEATVVVNNSQM